jgi:hypothetical protein
MEIISDSNYSDFTELAGSEGRPTTVGSYSIAYDVFSLALVIVFAALGGFLISIFGGLHTHKFGPIPAININPILKKFKLPPLIGMITFGMIARNCFGREVIAY